MNKLTFKVTCLNIDNISIITHQVGHKFGIALLIKVSPHGWSKP
jgi:hypothetical protein